jgi:hypothetical protein
MALNAKWGELFGNGSSGTGIKLASADAPGGGGGSGAPDLKASQGPWTTVSGVAKALHTSSASASTAPVRDDANRMVLAETRAQTQLDLNAVGPEPEKYIKHPSHGRTYRNPAWTEWSEKRAPYLAKLAGMNTVQERFDRTGQVSRPGERPLPEAYLLGFDTRGISHAIVANGNPDTATHTSVYVPGTTSNLEGIGGDIKRMETLWRASDNLAGGDGVYTIT